MPVEIVKDEPIMDMAPPAGMHRIHFKGDPNQRFTCHDLRAHWRFVDSTHGYGWVSWLGGNVYKVGSDQVGQGKMLSDGTYRISFSCRGVLAYNNPVYCPMEVRADGQEPFRYTIKFLITEP